MESGALRFRGALRSAFIRPQDGDDPGDHICGHLDGLERLSEARGEVFFAEAWQGALAPIAGAAVVDVLLFLNVSGQRTAVVCAVQQAPEGYVSLRRTLRAVVSVQDGLNVAERIGIQKDGMLARVCLAAPYECPNVKWVLENLVHVAAGETFPRFDSNRFRKGRERIQTCCIQLKHTLHNVRIERIDFDGALRFVVAITEWRMAWEVSLRGLLTHSLLDFLAQVFGVVSRHDKVNPLDQARLRFRIFRNRRALLDKVDFNIEVFQRNRVAEVPIKAVGLFDDQCPAAAVPFEPSDHRVELLAARYLGRLNILKCLHDIEGVAVGVLTKQLRLGSEGEPLLLLFTARYAGVDDGLRHGGLHWNLSLSKRPHLTRKRV